MFKKIFIIIFITITLSFFWRGSIFAQQTGTGTFIGPGVSNVTTASERGSISGYIFLGYPVNKKPIMGADVFLYTSLSDMEQETNAFAKTTTNTSGYYIFTDLPVGQYKFYIRASNPEIIFTGYPHASVSLSSDTWINAYSINYIYASKEKAGSLAIFGWANDGGPMVIKPIPGVIVSIYESAADRANEKNPLKTVVTDHMGDFDLGDDFTQEKPYYIRGKRIIGNQVQIVDEDSRFEKYNVTYINVAVRFEQSVVASDNSKSDTASSAVYPITQEVTPNNDDTPVATSNNKGATLLRAKDDYKVYVINNGAKTWIKTIEEFYKNGYKWEDVVVVKSGTLSLYPEIAGIASSEILPTEKVKITAWRLNVRDHNSMNGKIITSVPRGQMFDFVAEENEWYKIKISDEKSGWIYGKYADKQ